MDPTTQTYLAALLGAVVAGGAVLAWHVSDRPRREAPAVEQPVVPAGVATVLAVLRSSAVVVDEDDVVRKASAPAHELGLVRGQQLVEEALAGLVHQVRRDGEIRETELQLSPRGRDQSLERTVTARVAPLGARLVLVLVEDRTRERQLEAVRQDFVANVSHELKTPVGAIRLLAEAVEDASGDPEAVERFAQRMRTESDRLSHLVQQVIELSRLQGDEPVREPGAVPVDEVVATAIDTTATDARARDVTVATGGEPGLQVRGSPEQVTIALSNLLANAVAYSSAGARVLVAARRDGARVEIAVTDQGVGIPSEDVDRIFERFYRVDPARHRSTGGTGLGLSIVKHIAATHGGAVRVWSAPGQGSTFTLSLPGQGGPEPGEPAAPADRARREDPSAADPRPSGPRGGGAA